MKLLIFYRFPDPDDSSSSNEPDNSNDAQSTDSLNNNGNSSDNSSAGSSDTTDTETPEGGTSNEPANSSDEQSGSSPSDTNEAGDNSSTGSTDDSSNTSSGTTDTTSTNSTTDSEGFKLLSAGTWNNSATLNFKGGQVMHFEIKNVNVLGTTISIESNLGGKKSLIIAPTQTADMRFDCFGSEPMGWTFNVSTNSDAFIVAWKLFSSWVPGDPPNG